MSQPVKLSDELVLDARLVSELSERSIAGQIEFWARLGKAVEPLLSGDKLLALKESGDLRPLSELLSSVDSNEGRRRVADFLNSQPYPHYESAPDQPGYLVRIEDSGKRTIGKFVNRKFQPLVKATAKVSKTRSIPKKVAVEKSKRSK